MHKVQWWKTHSLKNPSMLSEVTKWDILYFFCPREFLHLIIMFRVTYLSLVSLGKHPIITFQHFVVQPVWKNSRLLLLSLALDSDCDGSLQTACVPIGCSTLRFLVTADIAIGWLAVETSDVPYILKLASDDLTSWVASDTVSVASVMKRSCLKFSSHSLELRLQISWNKRLTQFNKPFQYQLFMTYIFSFEWDFFSWRVFVLVLSFFLWQKSLKARSWHTEVCVPARCTM